MQKQKQHAYHSIISESILITLVILFSTEAWTSDQHIWKLSLKEKTELNTKARKLAAEYYLEVLTIQHITVQMRENFHWNY